MVLIENLEDGRYHDDQDNREGIKEKSSRSKTKAERDKLFLLESTLINRPGQVQRIPIECIHKLFYTSSGDILRIQESQSPVLVLKLVNSPSAPDASSSTRTKTTSAPTSATSSPTKVGVMKAPTTPLKGNAKNVEWIALEFVPPDSVSGEISSSEEDTASEEGEEKDEDKGEKVKGMKETNQERSMFPSSYPTSPPTLALLEYILRLTTLEMSESQSHTLVTDEKLFMYLANESNLPSSATLSNGLGRSSFNENSNSSTSPPSNSDGRRKGERREHSSGRPSGDWNSGTQRVLGSPLHRKSFADKLRE